MNTTTTPVDKLDLELPKRGMPVTIITGFLGSGKTTLLNQILKNKQDLKIAVLVNEFGDINIDSQLLVSVEQDMVELTNGCICCTINDGLVDAVYRVLEREEKIDYLVIETTGVADPLPIILTFLGTELRDLTRLDSVLTLVDAELFDAEHFHSEAALKQLTYADITLLNKTDLVSTEKLKALEDYIFTVKSGAKILHSSYGEVPLPLILGVNRNSHDEYSSEHHEHHHHEDHKHEHHHHEDAHHEHHEHEHHSNHLDNDGFVSFSFQCDRPFDVQKFETFLVEEMPEQVFRAKGILWFSDSELRHIFQLSGQRYDLHGDAWTTSPKNQIVFIGRNLNGDQISSQLYKCLL
ncbi:CobW family GTP-binding protein [Calothrix sp. PCC 6303]|uniref:CobW family GTP-binding protein n=1 Tax=Calothrix sp. PCC 6303 TaxID=1170562 RepID=UPI0002A038E5|nr:GTP-binding protein [Calothrix sp. PCC 6303]AFZ03013.1 cobalamin synthesis protein P47K [Calothrix sp. PCC 6303]